MTIHEPLAADYILQETFLSGFNAPRGVLVDNQNNVFVSDTFVNTETFLTNNFIEKFDSSGNYLKAIEIGGLTSAKFASLPNSESFLSLRDDGLLMLISSDTFQVNPLFNLHDLEIDESAVYNITTEEVITDGSLVQPDFLVNDIAVRQDGEFLDLFITGESLSGIFPFVMKVKIKIGENLPLKGEVLIAGVRGLGLQTGQILPTQRTLGPGIAVNADGTVLTALPTFKGDENFSYPDLITFPIDFKPTNLINGDSKNVPVVLPNGVGFDSLGMTTDSAGNFYVLTNGVFSLGETQAAVVGIAASLRGTPKIVKVLGSPSVDFPRGDVALDSVDENVYITFNNSIVKVSALNIGEVPTFNLDIDGNSQALPGTDGILGSRYLIRLSLGFDGLNQASLTNAVAPDATRTDLAAINNYLADLVSPDNNIPLDIDSNSQALPGTDGILVSRYLIRLSLGFDGLNQASLTNAVAPDATRTDLDDFNAYLGNLIDISNN